MDKQNKNEQEVLLSNLQSLYHFLHPNGNTPTTPSPGESSTSPTTDHHNKLRGQHVKVPLTSKAFFDGKLEPTVTKCNARSISAGGEMSARKCDDGGASGNDNHDGDSDGECEEQVVVNLGKGFMVEMTKREACAYLEQRMKPLLQQQQHHEERHHQSKASELASRASESRIIERNKNIHYTKQNKLQLKKGFLNKPNSKKKKPVQMDVRKNIVEQFTPNSMSNSDVHSNTNAVSTSILSTPVPKLPFMEIREEYDKDGNEIKAEALDVSRELLNFQRELKSKKEDTEKRSNVSVNHTTANSVDEDINAKESIKFQSKERNEIVNTLLENLPDLSEGDINIGDTRATVKTFDNENKNDIKNRKVKHIEKQDHLEGVIKEQNGGDSTSESSDYDEISTRLNRLILLEEQHEMKKAENKKSSKRLRGKGWAKGFFLEDKNKKAISSPSQPSNTSASSKTKVGGKEVQAQVGSKNSNDNGYDNVNEDNTVKKSQNKRVVQFKPSNEVKEIPRIGTRSITGTDSTANVLQNIAKSMGMPQSTNASTKRKPVSIGGVIERNHQENLKSNRIPEIVVDRDKPEAAAANLQAPKKKLSRFAQRRQQQRQA